MDAVWSEQRMEELNGFYRPGRKVAGNFLPENDDLGLESEDNDDEPATVSLMPCPTC